MKIPCDGGPLHGTEVEVPAPPVSQLRALWPPDLSSAAFILASEPRPIREPQTPVALYDLQVSRSWDGCPVYRYACPQLEDPRGINRPGYVPTRAERIQERVAAEIAAITARVAAEEAVRADALAGHLAANEHDGACCDSCMDDWADGYGYLDDRCCCRAIKDAG